MSTGAPISRTAAIAQLQEFYEKHGRSPSCRELKSPSASGCPHTRTLTRLFGGEKAALEAAGLPPRPRNVTPPYKPPRDPTLTPLEHQWYETRRVVEYIEGANVGPVYSQLAWQSEASARRWNAIKHGGQPYARLDVVDKILTLLGLHIWHLGDPDLISAAPPRARSDYQLSIEEAA